MTSTSLPSSVPFVNSIFEDNASSYHECGYNVIPLRPLTKIPMVTNWQHYCSARLDPWTLSQWISTYPSANIGIPLGEAVNLIALDFDNDINGLHTEIVKLLDGSPVKKKGNKGFTAFYRYNGETPKKWFKDGKAVVELLSTGNQTVVPPSIHPDTKQPYVWLTPDTLFDITASELPTLPEGFIDKVDELFGYTKKITNFNKKYEGDAPEIDEVEKALSFVPAGEYATWITVGMALHHTYGDSGFNAWDAWSCKAPNYDASKMQAKWHSFGKGKTVATVGTIFHHAIGCGYIMPRDEPFLDFTIPVENAIINITESAVATIDDFPENLLNAPGLPGEIALWINSVAIRRQPILALAAGICAAGTIFAHRIRSETDLRTNFMILGVAVSGGGKERPAQCVDALFRACGVDRLLLGEFPSDAGMLSALHDNNGIGMTILDEIGRELKSLTGKNSNSHESRILTTMMKMFSRASTTYRGKQYANHDGKMSRKDIIQPCLNVLGTTVPKRFYDALTSDDAIDGFLARWLLFQSNDIDPPEQSGGNVDIVPQKLIDNIKDILSWEVYRAPEALDFQSVPTPSPRVIEFTGGAAEKLKAFGDLCNENRKKELLKNSGLDAIWNRTREHAIKLALVAHPYEHGVIETVTINWACNMAMYLTHAAIKAIQENIFDSEYQKDMEKIYNIIKKYNERNNEAMRQGVLANAVRFMNMQDRTRILQHLVESGRVSAVETKYNNKIIYSYLTN